MEEHTSLSPYETVIVHRSRGRYMKGLLVRWLQSFKYRKAVRVARRRGATIGEGVVMPMALARKANANLVIGDHVSIQTSSLDVRCPLHIGSHVIIGSGVTVWTLSHDIDSTDFRLKPYGLAIEDYVWLSSDAMILPSCRHIGRGAVVGAGSVVVSDVSSMSVVGGNPAKEFRKRKEVHTELVVESLLGGDYQAYRDARRKGKEAGRSI